MASAYLNIQMLSYFGHIARCKSNNLEKVILLQIIIEGKRRDDLGFDGLTR